MTLAIGLLVVAGVLVGNAALYDTVKACPGGNDYSPNGTDFCSNSTGGSIAYDNSAATNVTSNLGGMVQNFGSQLPTVGTMFGVALILGAIGLIGLGIAVGARNMR